MAKSPLKPSIIYPDQPTHELVSLPKVHSEFKEEFLQELLANHPELLPVSSMRGDVGELLCVGREVGVKSGSIDNLYLSTSGYPVLVETKLWRNPEARRVVFAQTLEYVKDLTQKSFAWFEEQWKQHRQGTTFADQGLIDRISELAAAEDIDDEGIFVDRVNGALQRGDILAMIVGDGIETRLQELVDHLCQDSAHLRYGLALCELSFFQLPESKGLLVVPRIVNNVNPVERAHVRIELDKNLASHVVITPVKVPPSLRPTPVRSSLNEDEYLNAVELVGGIDLRRAIESTYNDLEVTYDLELSFGASSVSVKIPDPEGEKTSASLITFDNKGRIYNSSHLYGQLRKWEGLSEADTSRLCSEYWSDLNRIDSRFGLEGIKHKAWTQFLPFREVQEKWPSIKTVIGDFVGKVRSFIEKT